VDKVDSHKSRYLAVLDDFDKLGEVKVRTKGDGNFDRKASPIPSSSIIASR